MDRSPLEQFLGQQLSAVQLQPPVRVSPGTPVREALALMRQDGHSSVIAMEGEVLAGIFTERDVLLKCMDDDFDWDQSIDAAGLTRSPRTIPATSTIADAVAMMQQHQYRTLPVMHAGAVTGLIRLGDILTALAECYPETVLNLPPRPNQVMEKPEGG